MTVAYHIILTLLILATINNNSQINCELLYIPDDEYDLLPPIFHIDPYDKCVQENKTFCKVTIKLMPVNSSAANWRHIEATKNSTNYYSHDELYHAICMEDFCGNAGSDGHNLNGSLAQCYSEKYSRIGLKAIPVQFNCSNNYVSSNHIRIIDVLILIAFIWYVVFVIIATIYDYALNNLKANCNKYLISFSFINNWNKLKTTNRRPSNQPLLECVQGMRFYNTVLIIFCHTYASYLAGYIANTKYLEDIGRNHFVNSLTFLFRYIVQTYFLLSAWFLSYNTFQKLDKLKILTIRHVLLMLLNRYLRILPPLLVAIGIFSSTWLHRFYYYGPLKELFADLEYRNCANNWWTNFLLINNHYRPMSMCYLISWYLAADFQLYAISLVVLFVIWRLKSHVNSILAFAILMGIAVPAIVTYVYNMDIIFRIYPNTIKNNAFRTFEIETTYISTYVNMPTYMVGLTLGYINYKYKNKKINKSNKLIRMAWWLGFMGLPLLTVILSHYKYSRPVSALLSGMLKPTYALGIGIGILGMTKGLGGWVRTLCEWRPVVFLATFSYSTYIIQWIRIFGRTCASSAPIYVSNVSVFVSLIGDVLMSFLFGFIIHLMVEMPCLRLQKMIVPQVESEVRIKGKSK